MRTDSMSGSLSKAMPYVDKVNGDAGLAGLPFDADRCEGIRSAAPVMVTPIGYVLGAAGALAVLAAVIGGRRR